MNIPNPENSNRPKKNEPKKEEPSLQKLIEDIAKKNPVPAENKIPLNPPDNAEAEKVKKYLKELKIDLTSCRGEKMILGDVIVDATGIKEGRIGVYKGVRRAAFIYAFGDKRVKTLLLTFRDGISIRELASGIVWGYCSGIPADIVSGQFLEMDAFFGMLGADEEDQCDQELLQKVKKELELKYASRILDGEKIIRRISDVKESLEKRVQELEKALVEEKKAREELLREYLSEQHSAVHWKWCSVFVVSAFSVAFLIMK